MSREMQIEQTKCLKVAIGSTWNLQQWRTECNLVESHKLWNTDSLSNKTVTFHVSYLAILAKAILVLYKNKVKPCNV